MKHRNLWLGTALVGLLIGGGFPAGAQEYYRFKPNDKPAVEIDMSLLDSAPGPAAKPEKKVAEYRYLRSPAIEDKAPEPSAAPPIQEEATEPKPVIAVPPVPPPDDKPRKAAVPAVEEKAAEVKPALKSSKKPSLTITNEPAPVRKPSLKVVNEPAPVKPKPSMEITSKPAPEPAAAPLAYVTPTPAAASTAIVSQPPKPEAAVTAPAHRDLHQLPPIISNPPDAKAPPVVVKKATASPAVPVPALPSAPVVAPPQAPPETAAAPEVKMPSVPAPAVVSAPVTEPAPPSAPVENEKRPASNPLPEITVVHDADHPEVSEPAPIAQPAPPKPRADPPLLPRSGKPGQTTSEAMPDFARSANPVQPPAEPAPEHAETASPPEHPAETPSMPVVPTMADLTLAFPGHSSDLTTETQKKLDAVIRQMKEMGEGRLQVRGFATGEDGSKSSARRIALSRALSVRSYLIDKGIKATRVDVRAMGTETERSPLDRVDLIFAR